MNGLPQFVHIEFGGVDDRVGELAMARGARALGDAALTLCAVPSGCGRRVSLNAESATIRSDSRKISRVGTCRRMRLYKAGKRSNAAPSRISTTSAARRMVGASL